MNNVPINDNVLIDRRRLAARQTDELIGICRGILFDGIVSIDEARNLLIWFKANGHARNEWPGKELYLVLRDMLSNGTLSSDDERRLLIMLSHLIGLPKFDNSGYQTEISTGHTASTQLPLCNPAPAVIFEGSVFVLTGNFSLGSRDEVIGLIRDLGGEVVLKNVRKDTRYMVIGDIGSRAWMHSTHGRKIEKAVELREQGRPIAIISEQHFVDSISANYSQEIQELLDAEDDQITPFFSAFMERLEDFEALEKIGIKTFLYENAVALHHCFQNGKPQTVPSFSVELDEVKEKPWGVYGLSKPLLFYMPEEALDELLRLARI